MSRILNEPYDNQADIDKLKAMVAGISPDLKPSGYYLSGDEKFVTCVVVTVLMKDNKDVIAKLVSAGFVKGRKRKVGNGHEWPSFGGYSFCIPLLYNMNDPVNIRRLRKEEQHGEQSY